MKLAWVNREKTVFLGTFAALVLAGSYALLSKPMFQDEGVERVRESAPGRMAVNLQVSRPGEMEAFLTGARSNPFAAYLAPRTVTEPTPREPPVRPPRHTPTVDVLPPPPPIGPPPTVKPPTIVLFVNDSELLHFSYKRYLENQIRKTYGYEGTPIRIIARHADREKDSG